MDTTIKEESFTEIYELYWKDLYLYCDHYLKDEEISKELVQDIFISLWENRNKTVINKSLKQYLFGAAKLKILEYYRKQTIRQKYIKYKLLQPVSTGSTEEQVNYNELHHAFSQAVNGLPEKSQLVYQLSRYEGMNNKSIAATLSITEKAVEGNMSRAIAYIRKKLKAFNQEHTNDESKR